MAWSAAGAARYPPCPAPPKCRPDRPRIYASPLRLPSGVYITRPRGSGQHLPPWPVLCQPAGCWMKGPPMSARPTSPLARAQGFCSRYGLEIPVLMAPMAGSCPPALAAAVANAGGMGACGALPLPAAGIADWAARFRQQSPGAFQINLWVPDAPRPRDAGAEAAQARFLSRFGPEPAIPEGPLLADFDAQFGAILDAAPPVASSIMGLFRPDQVAALKARK